jgi:hypothetical protein
MTKLGGKVRNRVACLPDGGGGAGGVRRAFTAGYSHHVVVLPVGASSGA